MPSPLKPREQGDWGELAAMTWLMSRGACVYRPVFHSPDIDLVAVLGDRALRVEVKTSMCPDENDRWMVRISTRGGNQSWSGLVKYFDPMRCDYLFVLVGDGRQWFIPTAALGCRSDLTLGGPKYSEHEVQRGHPIPSIPRAHDTPLNSHTPEGEYPRGQRTAAVNRQAQAFAGSTPASPMAAPSGLKFSKYERKLGRSGQAIINQKRRVNIPQRPFFEAGFEQGDRVRVRSDGYGRVVLERIELPAWALPD
jgi:hypothetical protein